MADANALIADAFLITTASGSLSNINNVNAGVEPGEPNPERTNSLWWHFYLSGPATLTIKQPTPFDAYLLLYKAPLLGNPAMSDLFLVAYDDDGAGGGGAINNYNATIGHYYIKYASYSSASSTLGNLNWSGLTTVLTTPPPPASLVLLKPPLLKFTYGAGTPIVPKTGQIWPRGNR